MASNHAVRLPPLPSIRDILKLFKLTAMRQLSQNFLLDQHLNNKLVKSCGSIKGAEVCEVGPGPGNITRSLISKGAKKIHLVEKDNRFFPSLQMLSEAAPGTLNLRSGDVLTLDMSNLFEEERRKNWDDIPPNIYLVGNLPFNIATPLIIKWIRAISEKNNAWSYGRVRMVLTFQKEVAERMVSPIMSASRCRLSVMSQNWCDVYLKFIIPGKAFLPKPKVDVGVVQLIPRKKPIIPLSFELVEKVVKAIFMFRQKHVIRGLETLFPVEDKVKLSQKLLKDADIDYKIRSFQLSNIEIGKICFAYEGIVAENPWLMKFDRLSENLDWETKERQSEEEINALKQSIISDEFY